MSGHIKWHDSPIPSFWVKLTPHGQVRKKEQVGKKTRTQNMQMHILFFHWYIHRPCANSWSEWVQKLYKQANYSSIPMPDDILTKFRNWTNKLATISDCSSIPNPDDILTEFRNWTYKLTIIFYYTSIPIPWWCFNWIR